MHLHGHCREQRLAQRQAGHRRPRERNVHGEKTVTARDSGFGIRDLRITAATLLVACAALFAGHRFAGHGFVGHRFSGAFIAVVHAQAPDPEALYKANCSSCHDQPEGRTPPRAALKDKTPEAILTAMTSGSMSVQAVNIAPADKRRLAELLAGKPFS